MKKTDPGQLTFSARAPVETGSTIRGQFYITTPIYYINDRPHIGTAYTTIAADVLARYYRQKLGAENVFFLTGTDEHGAKIEKKSKDEGQEPQAFADEISEQFRQAWKELNISHDDFIRTTEPRHIEVVNRLMLQLREATTPTGQAAVYKGEYSGLYCVGHEAFMKESDLVDGLCPDHKTKPELITEKNWFFRLSDYASLLTEKIRAGEFTIAPESRKNEILGYLKEGLEDTAISRPNVTWGIPVPFDEAQTVYVWVEALMNYVSALGGPGGQKFKKFWPADIHLIGKDIIKFHCVIWPALLQALDIPWPRMVFANGFFTVNGEKMSKSLGNAVDPLAMKAKFGNDALRYAILRDVAFGTDGDFSETKVAERYTSDLANGLGNLVSRVTNMLEKYTGGEFTRTQMLGSKLLTAYQEALEKQVRLDRALEDVWQEVTAANKLIDDTAPWKMAKDGKEAEVRALLNELANKVLDINELLVPFMPETAQKITRAFAQPVKKAEPLFPRLV